MFVSVCVCLFENCILPCYWAVVGSFEIVWHALDGCYKCFRFLNITEQRQKKDSETECWELYVTSSQFISNLGGDAYIYHRTYIYIVFPQ